MRVGSFSANNYDDGRGIKAPAIDKKGDNTMTINITSSNIETTLTHIGRISDALTFHMIDHKISFDTCKSFWNRLLREMDQYASINIIILDNDATKHAIKNCIYSCFGYDEKISDDNMIISLDEITL